MKKILRILLFALGILALMLAIPIVVFWRQDLPLEFLQERYARPPSQFLPVTGMPVHFRDEGVEQDSLPIVLLHGTGASLHTWEGWVQALKAERRIIRFDLPGFGLTGPAPDHDYSMEGYTAFLGAFLDSLGVDSCVLGGNSLGGAISWHFALRQPKRVKSLILVDAAGIPARSTKTPIAFRLARIRWLAPVLKNITPRFLVEKSVRNVYAAPGKVDEALIDRYYELSLREGNRDAFIARMQQVSGIPDTSRLKELHAPALLIWGAKDGLTPLESGRRLAALLPNDTLIIFENLGHVPMEEDPEGTVQVVKDFLREM